jgi:hypothetical protein
MSKLRLKNSMSLDGFVAGPDQGVENPLGIAPVRTVATPNVTHLKFAKRCELLMSARAPNNS